MRRVSMGWVRQVSVFVNGIRVFADENLYGTPAKRKPPGGRVAFENGSFDLPLHRGINTILVGVGDRGSEWQASRYGWGAMLRLDTRNGLREIGN